MTNAMRQALTVLDARWRRRALWIASALLLALLAWQAVGYFRLRRSERRIAELLNLQTGDVPKRTEGKPLTEYDVLTKKDLLGVVVKNEKLWGILGDCALYGEKSDSAQEYRVGATLPGGDKVVSIDENSIVLEKDGAQRTEYVFQELKQPKGPKGPSKEVPNP
jgi:hypothetical protein